MNQEQAQEVLWRIRDDIPVGPPPITNVITAASGLRRRRKIAWATGGVAVCAIVTALIIPTLVDRTDNNAATPAQNPANIPWWADGELHLDEVLVPTLEPDTLVQVRDGVVYWAYPEVGTAPSPVIHVAEDGEATTLGHKTYASPIVSDPATGWVAWVDDTATAPPVLVVYDTDAGTELASLELAERGARWEVLDEGSYPIAIDDRRVYFAAQDGDYQWDPTSDQPAEQITDADTYLLDSRAGVRLLRTDDDGYGNPVIRRRGASDVQLDDESVVGLSSDARYVATISYPAALAAIYDAYTGTMLDTGLSGSRPTSALAFGPDGTITYALGTKPHNEPNGMTLMRVSTPPYDLVTCEIATATCETVAHDVAPDLVVLPD